MTASTQLEPLKMDYPHQDLESASRVRGAVPVSLAASATSASTHKDAGAASWR